MSIKKSLSLITIGMCALFCVVAVSLFIVEGKSLGNELTKSIYLKKIYGDLNSAKQYIKNYYGGITLNAENKLSDQNGNVIEYNYELVDIISSDLGDLVTIFKKDGDDFKRVITTVKDEKGNRAVDTVLDKKSKVYEALSQGKSFSGEAFILQKHYLTEYVPIKNSDGNIIGALFFGVNKSEAVKLTSSKINEVNLLIFIVFIILTILIQIVISRFIRKIVISPVLILRETLKKMEQKDFQFEFDKRLLQKKDEIGDIARGLDELKETIKSTVRDIAGSSERVASSATEMSATMSSISEGAQGQARNTDLLENNVYQLREKMEEVTDNVRNQTAGVQQVSSSIAEVSESINRVSKNAENTIVIAQETSVSAKNGDEAINSSFAGIKKLEDIVGGIEEILGKINQISEQTNLLALNAAIEAARAGEAGKGFAVVADEVRKLAENSKEATGGINDMLGKARVTMKENVKLAEASKRSLTDIMDKVAKTNSEIQNVSALMEEQATAIEEITKAVQNIAVGSSNVEGLAIDQVEIFEHIEERTKEIAQVAQITASSIEEAFATSEELSNVAEDLEELVKEFKIKS